MALRTAAWSLVGVLGLGLSAAGLRAEDPSVPLVYADDFGQGAENWQPTDPQAWKVEQVDGKHVYSLVKKRSDYDPPHRSPYNISLLRDIHVSDFVLTVKVRSTDRDYPHQDMCLFFGYQDPAHFYYVHLGKRTDDHSNQIFIVNDKPRTKISLKTTDGTPWTEDWHQVKIVRRVEDGTIEVYFDDLETPAMVARDKTFTWGRVGLGSFDDTGQWDDFQLHGTKVDRN